MEDGGSDIRFRSVQRDVVQTEELAVREREQQIVLRYVIVGVVLALYSVTLLATLALIYMAGLGKVSFTQTVLTTLVAVFGGELGVGALLVVIVKNLFPNS